MFCERDELQHSCLHCLLVQLPGKKVEISYKKEGEMDLEDDLLHTLKNQDILMPMTGKNISRYS